MTDNDSVEWQCHPGLLLPVGELGLLVAQRLGSGRIVASEKEAPNMLANMVYCRTDERWYKATMRPSPRCHRLAGLRDLLRVVAEQQDELVHEVLDHLRAAGSRGQGG
jgi:hypothetical protein